MYEVYTFVKMREFGTKFIFKELIREVLQIIVNLV